MIGAILLAPWNIHKIITTLVHVVFNLRRNVFISTILTNAHELVRNHSTFKWLFMPANHTLQRISIMQCVNQHRAVQVFHYWIALKKEVRLSETDSFKKCMNWIISEWINDRNRKMTKNTKNSQRNGYKLT